MFSKALTAARASGWLGTDIKGSGIDFDIDLHLGAGSYVCGEETAMLESLEGKAGLIRYKPPLPALQGLYSKADKELGHFRRYRKKSLRELVEQAGFEVRRIRYFDIAGIIPWYVYFVLMRRSIGRSPVSLYDRLVVPVMRPIERLITPPIGKNLLLVARKPTVG